VLRFVANVLITVWLAFLTAAAVFCHLPASLEGVQGLDGAPKPQTRDVRERIEQAVLNRTTPLVLTEAEVNRWLGNVLHGEERGASHWLAEFDRVALSFENGYCRAWLIWKSGSSARTASVDFTLRREKKEYVIEPVAGHLGRLPVFRGAAVAVLPGLQRLCATLSEEPNDLIRPVFEMNAITFEKGKVRLDPRLEVTK
jgi:hypothetical protein